jgi:hypothetical protein
VGTGDVDHVLGGHLATEILEFIHDFHGPAHTQIGGDEVGLDLIPFDLGAVGAWVCRRLRLVRRFPRRRAGRRAPKCDGT